MLNSSYFSEKWPVVSLGDAVTFLDNLRKPIKASDRTEGEYLYYGANGVQGTINEFIFDEPLLLLAEDGGHFGNPDRDIAYIAKGKYWVNNHAHVLKPIMGLDLNFLYRVLQRYDVTPFIKGATRAKLTKGDAARIPIPLPPLAEQQRIAAILDKADAIRRKRQQAIQLADDFLRAVFLDMFGDPVTNPKGWEVCKYEDLVSLVTYGLTVRPKYYKEGIPLISAREIRTGELNLESCPKISREDFDKLSEKGRPKKDDILFSKTGSIGHCAIVRTDLDFAVTQNAARIVVNSDVCNPTFLLAFMRTKYFYDMANKEAKGNAVKDLQLGVMKAFPMYKPPLWLQDKFVELYVAAATFSGKVRDGSDMLVSNFNALSQKAFSGNL